MFRCLSSCKDTNSKAIHNNRASRHVAWYVVFHLAKILIRKQFTTVRQPHPFKNCCLSSCKDTNSKAIHNCVWGFHERLRVVFHLAKILIRKQFTTSTASCAYLLSCLSSCKDTNSKAIHNYHRSCSPANRVVFHLAKILIRKQFTTQSSLLMISFRCLSSCKDTNSKAIHNSSVKAMIGRIVVFHLAKILIRKQFTTCFFLFFFSKKLSFILQRY